MVRIVVIIRLPTRRQPSGEPLARCRGSSPQGVLGRRHCYTWRFMPCGNAREAFGAPPGVPSFTASLSAACRAAVAWTWRMLSLQAANQHMQPSGITSNHRVDRGRGAHSGAHARACGLLEWRKTSSGGSYCGSAALMYQQPQSDASMNSSATTAVTGSTTTALGFRRRPPRRDPPCASRVPEVLIRPIEALETCFNQQGPY